MQVNFRNCRVDDVDISVPLIYSSGPAQFRFVFSVTHKEQALEFLAYCFVRGKGQFGFKNHTALVVDGKQVGVGAAWNSQSNLMFMLISVLHILRFYGLRKAIIVMLRGLKAERVIKPARHDVVYIGHLGIPETMRGKGLGRQLIMYFLQQSREQGFQKSGLDVECENRRAKKLYEALGFKDVVTLESNLKNKYGYILKHFYMERDL